MNTLIRPIPNILVSGPPKKASIAWASIRYRSTAASLSVKDRTEQPLLQKPAHLSPLTNKILLRSLLVATVSSHKMLLLPALSVMQFLSQPGRSWLFNLEKNRILRYILRATFYNQFCAGETKKQTSDCVSELKSLGFKGVILTYAKETSFDHATEQEVGHGVNTSTTSEAKLCSNIETWRQGNLETINLCSSGDILALKTTGGGPKVNEAFSRGELAPPQMMEALNEVCQTCKDRGIKVIVDAEFQHLQTGIARTALELMRKFNRNGNMVVYNTYQCYLKATPSVVSEHLEAASKDNFTLGLKLVRGAYIASDKRSLIHDTKQDTDDAYNMLAQGALQRQLGKFGSSGGPAFPSVHLFLASHNHESVMAANKLHQQRSSAGLPTVPVQFGQLHGMSDNVSFSLLAEKVGGVSPEVYKCTTWGPFAECLAYLVRRAVENQDAVLRTRDEYSALKSELMRRIRTGFGFFT